MVHSDHLPYCLAVEPWTFPLGFIIDSILQMGNGSMEGQTPWPKATYSLSGQARMEPKHHLPLNIKINSIKLICIESQLYAKSMSFGNKRI